MAPTLHIASANEVRLPVGEGLRHPIYPILAGQHANTWRDNCGCGSRARAAVPPSPTSWRRVARRLSDEDIDDVAAYYEALDHPGP
jgi:cytochrome c553